MKRIINLLVTGIVLISVSCQTQKDHSNYKLKTRLDTVTYLIASDFATQLYSGGHVDTLSEGALLKAIYDAFNEQTMEMDRREINRILNQYFYELEVMKIEENYTDIKEAGEAYMEKNKKKRGVITLESGLQYRIIKEGDGPIPVEEDRVVVHLVGKRINGEVIESSRDGGLPTPLDIKSVIPGLAEALQLMPVGSIWEITIPQNLGYGTYPKVGSRIKPYETVIYEVELLGISEATEEEE